MAGPAVYYAFASVPSQKYRIDCAHRIAVPDLKARIAESKFIDVNDLELSDEATGRVFQDEEFVISSTSMLVRRVPQINRKRPKITLDTEKRLITMTKTPEPKAPSPEAPVAAAGGKRPFPPDLLCPVCRMPYSEPMLLSCCSASACASCLPSSASGSVQCPVCQNSVLARLWKPNKTLKDTVMGLDWDAFITEPKWYDHCNIKRTHVWVAPGDVVMRSERRELLGGPWPLPRDVTRERFAKLVIVFEEDGGILDYQLHTLDWTAPVPVDAKGIQKGRERLWMLRKVLNFKMSVAEWQPPSRAQALTDADADVLDKALCKIHPDPKAKVDAWNSNGDRSDRQRGSGLSIDSLASTTLRGGWAQPLSRYEFEIAKRKWVATRKRIEKKEKKRRKKKKERKRMRRASKADAE